MSELQGDGDTLPTERERGRPNKEWGMQDPRLASRLYIDAQGMLAVKGAEEAPVPEPETLERPCLSPEQVLVLITALAATSEQELGYDALMAPFSSADQSELSL